MVEYFGQPLETFARRMQQINADNIEMWQKQYSEVYAVERELKDYVDLYNMATGDVSSQQLVKNILNNWEAYVDVLTVENGELKISKELVLQKAQAQIEAIKATIKEKIADAEADITRNKITLESLKASQEAAKERIKAINIQIEALGKLIGVLNAKRAAERGEAAEISAYNRDMSRWQTRIDEINTSIANQTEYINLLKNQLAALDKIDLESLLKEASTSTSRATSATKKLNDELTKLKNLLSALQKQMTDTTNVYEKVQAAMKDIVEAEIDALEKENDSLDDGLKYYEARIKLIEEYYDSGIAKLEEQKKAAEEAFGKKGDVVALEVNMRPSGGFTPDMINFANSTDVYKIWADMIAYDSTLVNEGEHFFCGFVGLRDERNYVMSKEDVMAKYGHCMKMVERIPDALSGAMGNQMYMANFATKEDMEAFYRDVTAEK